MPRFGYYCPICDPEIESAFDIIKQTDTPEVCHKCGNLLERNFNQRGLHCGNKSYSSPLISESLGIHPDQAAEHRKNHPNVEVMPEGQLKFDNYQAHNKYLKDIGWDKQIAKRKRVSR